MWKHNAKLQSKNAMQNHNAKTQCENAMWTCNVKMQCKNAMQKCNAKMQCKNAMQKCTELGKRSWFTLKYRSRTVQPTLYTSSSSSGAYNRFQKVFNETFKNSQQLFNFHNYVLLGGIYWSGWPGACNIRHYGFVIYGKWPNF